MISLPHIIFNVKKFNTLKKMLPDKWPSELQMFDMESVTCQENW